jgi:hypothetical protein
MTEPVYASLRPIVVGGLVAGTVDIGSASLINALSPRIILHFVASGVLGSSALAGGAAVVCLGLLLQWAMSILIAAIYLAVIAGLPALRRRWVLGGLLAGAVIFTVMNFLVVPLSAAPVTFRYVVTHIRMLKAAENLFAMFVFGWIVAFAARHGGVARGKPPPAPQTAPEASVQ